MPVAVGIQLGACPTVNTVCVVSGALFCVIREVAEGEVCAAGSLLHIWWHGAQHGIIGG